MIVHKLLLSSSFSPLFKLVNVNGSKNEIPKYTKEDTNQLYQIIGVAYLNLPINNDFIYPLSSTI